MRPSDNHLVFQADAMESRGRVTVIDGVTAAISSKTGLTLQRIEAATLWTAVRGLISAMTKLAHGLQNRVRPHCGSLDQILRQPVLVPPRRCHLMVYDASRFWAYNLSSAKDLGPSDDYRQSSIFLNLVGSQMIPR